MRINPKLRGQAPRVDAPVAYQSRDGRIKGWKASLPGRRPLATPAVVGGRVFVGGGFGSYDFFALDAASGRVAWHYQTTDDGPTAAAVCDDRVAFNTESCELEVLTTDGRPVWKKWLGDPLLSMPALGGGKVFVAYPDSRGDRRHYLVAFDLDSGQEVWKQPIPGEVITAPVLAEGCVYLATLGGVLCCFRQGDGRLLWQEAKDATSSPVVWQGQCYFSQSREVPPDRTGGLDPRKMEHLARRASAAAAETVSFPGTAGMADYLDYGKRHGKSPMDLACAHADAAVGFGAYKGDAKMEQARKNLGHGHVSGVWAYQGSKPFLAGGRLYSALGDTVHCVDPHTREAYWKRTLHERAGGAELLDSAVTPPTVVNGKLFLGTVGGEVFCLSAATGDVLWKVEVGEPVVFQPAAAGGRLYVPTYAGGLFCLETGDPADDGWRMWGGDAAHNGLIG
jgi:outer membrane protein assembly factor BamB